MNLSVIVYTGNGFDTDTKLPILQSCINSIKRQKSDNVEILVICEDGDKAVIERETGVGAIVYEKPEECLNSVISKLSSDKFIIARYDTLFSTNSISALSACGKGEGMLFNVTLKKKGTSDFYPLFSSVSIKNEMSIAPSVWNVVFDTQTVKNNKLSFTDFSYRDQYLYLMNFFMCAEKIVCSDAVLLCLDRTLKPTIRPSGKYYMNNRKAIFSLVRKLKKSRNGALLSCFVRDFGVPLVELSYKEKSRRRRWYYRLYCNRFMRCASSVLR